MYKEPIYTMLTLQKLESFLWQTADILRGNMDGSEYRDDIFGIQAHFDPFAVGDKENEPVKLNLF